MVRVCGGGCGRGGWRVWERGVGVWERGVGGVGEGCGGCERGGWGVWERGVGGVRGASEGFKISKGV